MAVGTITAATSAPAGKVQDRLDTPPSFSFMTQKTPAALEFCIADAISDMAAPSAVRDGPNRIVIVGTGGLDKVIAAVELNGGAGATQVIGHLQGRNWDDRMRERVARCL